MPEVTKITREEYEKLKDQAFYSRIADEQFYRTTWIRRFWRPFIAWLYAIIVLFDFLIFPGLMFADGKTWQPLTLMGNGMFHIAMGAIVGASAFTRGAYEKAYEYGINPYGGYSYNNYDSYNNQPVMMPRDNVGDALSNNEDEIIPPNPKTR